MLERQSRLFSYPSSTMNWGILGESIRDLMEQLRGMGLGRPLGHTQPKLNPKDCSWAFLSSVLSLWLSQVGSKEGKREQVRVGPCTKSGGTGSMRNQGTLLTTGLCGHPTLSTHSHDSH